MINYYLRDDVIKSGTDSEPSDQRDDEKQEKQRYHVAQVFENYENKGQFQTFIDLFCFCHHHECGKTKKII